MFKFIKRLFRKSKQPTITFESERIERIESDPSFPDEIENDPFMREVLLRCIRSNKMVIGNKDADGSVSFTEVD